MVGGDHVAQHRQNARAVKVADHPRFAAHAFEIRWVLDVGRGRRPVVGLARRGLDRLPARIALEHVGVFLLERGPCHGGLDQLGDFAVGGPDVAQIDRAAGALPQRLARQIDVDVTRQGIGHHQRRRGQIVGAHVRADAALEVAVARQHGGGDQIALGNRRRDRRVQRPRVADAGGAAIAHQIEPHRIEIFLQPGGGQVFADHLRARGQRGLDPGFAGQSQRAGLARQQPRPDHHIGVRGVGARGDRGNHHMARMQGVVLALDRHFLAQRALEGPRHFARESGLGLGQRGVILRPLRTRDRGHHAAHVQRQGVGIDRVIVGATPHALRLGIGFDQRDAGLVAPGTPQIAQGLGVNREVAAGGTVFRRHVADRGAVGQRQMVKARPVELDELAHHALGAQHLHHPQHQIGGGGALDHLAGQLEAHHFGDQHRDRLAQHRRLGLDPAHAPAQHGQTVDHGGVAVGADQSVGIGHFSAGLIGVAPHRLGQIFKVDLVTDAGARRHHAKVGKRPLTPFQELIALDVALVFAIHVHLEGARCAEFVDHHRVVDHQIDRGQRVDLLGVAAKRQNSVTHRRQIDHRRHPGEILHQHPRRAVGDLARVAAPLGPPFGKGADVIDRHGLAILEAQHVFQHHLQAGRQAGKAAQARGFGCRDRVIGNRAPSCGQGLAGFHAVMSDGDGHYGLLGLAPAMADAKGCVMPRKTRRRKGVGAVVCNCMPKIQPPQRSDALQSAHLPETLQERFPARKTLIGMRQSHWLERSDEIGSG